MHEANSPIKIFEGVFNLKNDMIQVELSGSISFTWFVESGAHFSGSTNLDRRSLMAAFDEKNEYTLTANGIEMGQCYISNIIFGLEVNSVSILEGVFTQQVISGDKSIKVEKVIFSVPNLREFHGASVKWIKEERHGFTRGRLHLEDDLFEININKCLNYKELYKSLSVKGGYAILYQGELKKKSAGISHEEATEVLLCLNCFLSFINGRRISALFIQGIFDNEEKWCDYTDYQVDIYKSAQTWTTLTGVSFDELWKAFRNIWKEDKDFLISTIHWYVESNSNSGFTDGSIMMAQTAIELLYNWWIVERKKMILGKDSASITASNKIRLLLSQINLSNGVPSSLTHLSKLIKPSESIDAPDAIVQIRNSIVHSQEEKRKKLTNIDPKAKFEALQLSLWYIEMALLRILEYKGKFNNRVNVE
ncbi:hypothetical protein [Telluribacter humicola]|uniref:hypothetical protein n=1 Tax=Telluribacter humicola TaxID=1720261 RepID=UPI001A973E03|nr:hypothetical protein [Telluribacter humicola]